MVTISFSLIMMIINHSDFKLNVDEAMVSLAGGDEVLSIAGSDEIWELPAAETAGVKLSGSGTVTTVEQIQVSVAL